MSETGFQFPSVLFLERTYVKTMIEIELTSTVKSENNYLRNSFRNNSARINVWYPPKIVKRPKLQRLWVYALKLQIVRHHLVGEIQAINRQSHENSKFRPIVEPLTDHPRGRPPGWSPKSGHS